MVVKELIPETLEFRNNPDGKVFPEDVLKRIFQHNEVLLKGQLSTGLPGLFSA